MTLTRFTPPLLMAMLLLPVLGAAPAIPARVTPTSEYHTRPIEGWTVRVNGRFAAADPQLLAQTLELLRCRLIEVHRAVPPAVLPLLQRVVIWVDDVDPTGLTPGMAYHPSADWLRAHGCNPDMAHGIQLGNARHFLDWGRVQPWMVLHELAHAYHDQVLGFNDPAIRSAYQQAVASHKYDSVLRASGRHERHYALTNEREYFAELTESYFGTNDFFPFVRAELHDFDPVGYQTIRHAWGLDQQH